MLLFLPLLQGKALGHSAVCIHKNRFLSLSVASRGRATTTTLRQLSTSPTMYLVQVVHSLLNVVPGTCFCTSGSSTKTRSYSTTKM